MSIGSRLKEERGRLRLSQTALAEVGGVSKTTQVFYESDERVPDANYFAAVSERGMDVSYVITGRREADMAASTFNRQLMADILRAIDDWVAGRKRPVPAEIRAEIAALFYSQFYKSGSADRDIMEGHLRLVA
ncbi:MAG: helix-turn-helix transcriptional regulator [Gammaproteobacteria bacterium]|nr:helix-turn-helix transcriptional regulator [Gammaproteobacteria bacterium]